MQREIAKEKAEKRLRPELEGKSDAAVKKYIRLKIEKRARTDALARYSHYVTKDGKTTNGWREEGIMQYNYFISQIWVELSQREFTKEIDQMVLDFYGKLPGAEKKKKKKVVEVEEGTVRKDQKAEKVVAHTFHLEMDPEKWEGKSEAEINAKLAELGVDAASFWKQLEDRGNEYISGPESDSDDSCYDEPDELDEGVDDSNVDNTEKTDGQLKDDRDYETDDQEKNNNKDE
jgi:hypothetical protein